MTINKIEDKEVEYIIKRVMEEVDIEGLDTNVPYVDIASILKKDLIEEIKKFINDKQRDEICPNCLSVIDDEYRISGIGGTPNEIIAVGYKCQCGYEEDY